jgi:hypothetical protein
MSSGRIPEHLKRKRKKKKNYESLNGSWFGGESW